MIKNRILEIRQQRKLSAEKLADIVGTTQSTIHRLETGKRKLTQEWMEKLGKALNVHPFELLPAAEKVQGYNNEVSISRPPTILSGAFVEEGVTEYYKIITSSVDRLGLQPGEVRLFNISKTAIDSVKTGDIVIVKIFDEVNEDKQVLLLRQYVAPCLLIVNSNFSTRPNIDMRKTHTEISAVLPNTLP